MKQERRTFSQEFKQEAVALVVEHGYSYAAAGRSLGIRGNLIGRWKRQLEDNGSEAFPGKGKRTAEQQRIHELETENRHSKSWLSPWWMYTTIVLGAGLIRARPITNASG